MSTGTGDPGQGYMNGRDLDLHRRVFRTDSLGQRIEGILRKEGLYQRPGEEPGRRRHASADFNIEYDTPREGKPFAGFFVSLLTDLSPDEVEDLMAKFPRLTPEGHVVRYNVFDLEGRPYQKGPALMGNSRAGYEE